MTSITTYLYKQNHQVVTNDTGVSNTMSMFYAPNIKIYRGMDNPVRVNFVNRDQKKTSLTDKTVQFIMIDQENSTTYLDRTVTIIDGPKGVGEVSLTESDLYSLDAKYYTYSFKITDGEGNSQIGYSDDNYGANGIIEIVEGVYPTFNASTLEDFTGGDTGSINYLKPYINRNVAQHTAQVYFSSAFTGSLIIEGSLSPQHSALSNNEFVTISTESYSGQSNPVMVNWNGIYSAVRFKRTTTTGTLSKVLYRP
jgi:hypothetical protein|tara:strand:- start:723 stop:1481 length:759 start_codon:yes stop_codon:yes gene_type:complete